MSSLLSVLIFVCECNKSIDDRSVMAVNYARRETDILIFNDTITRHHKTSHSSSLWLCSPKQHPQIDTALNVNKSKEMVCWVIMIGALLFVLRY